MYPKYVLSLFLYFDKAHLDVNYSDGERVIYILEQGWNLSR